MKKKSIFIVLPMMLSIALGASACDNIGSGIFTNTGSLIGGGEAVNTSELPSTTNTDETVNGIVNGAENNVTNETDFETEDDFETVSATIALADGASSTDNADAVEIDNTLNIIKITKKGTYVLSGTLTDGQVVVAKKADIQVVLNGVSITSSTSSPLILLKGKPEDDGTTYKKVITLAENSVNTLTDASTYTKFYDNDFEEVATEDDNKINGALYSQYDLTINGTGSLTVNGNYDKGISCKATLKILSGNITVNAIDDAIKGNDAIEIKGGNITINSTGDGMKNEEPDEEGDSTTSYISISDGTLDITAMADGVQAYDYLYVSGGDIDVKVGGGSSARNNTDDSFKGLKSENNIVISGGTVDIDSFDDGIHSNGSIVITGGEMNISTADDGVQADDILEIQGGTINVTKSYEGVESAKVLISGGTTSVIASDDGVNAADGTSTMGINSNCYVLITGGSLFINAGGDGLDSNGYMYIKGGEVYVDGPTNSANAALDSEGGIVIDGGTVVAVGAKGMVETPSTSSSQYTISYMSSSTIAANSDIELVNASGNTIVEFTTAKTCQSIIISASGLTNGTYSIKIGGTTTSTFTVSSVITSVGTTIGGNQGGGGFNPGIRR